MKIPFHKPYITEDEISEVVNSLKSGWLTMGPKTILFEEKFRKYIGADHMVSMNSCTACLHLALKAAGLRERDEVIVPAMTFTSTSEVVDYFGARPVFIDVESATLNMDPGLIDENRTPRTRGIIPVHYAGQPCDMDQIMQMAREYGLFVIEDAAHALPSMYRKRRIGTIGDATCFSFYATKTLSTGEGGMVATGNDEWAERMRILRLHGISKDAWKRYSGEGSWYYEVVETGYKYNMTDIQASLGVAQLRKLEWMWQKRKSIAAKYSEAFGAVDSLEVPSVKEDRESAWHLYVLRLRSDALKIGRNRFMEELKDRGIGTSMHFIPLYRQPFYQRKYGLSPRGFPECERNYDRMMSLPIYPAMSEDDVGTVIEAVLDVAKISRR